MQPITRYLADAQILIGHPKDWCQDRNDGIKAYPMRRTLSRAICASVAIGSADHRARHRSTTFR